MLVYIAGQDLPARTREEALELDQVECMYSPRVRCLGRGQTAKIHNSDPTMHNVHARIGGPRGRTLFNRAQMLASCWNPADDATRTR